MDVLGISYEKFPNQQRDAVVTAYPRPPRFKEEIIQAFYDGFKHRPDTTFGNVNADVLADKDPHFHRTNFCSVIRSSAWSRMRGPRPGNRNLGRRPVVYGGGYGDTVMSP